MSFATVLSVSHLVAFIRVCTSRLDGEKFLNLWFHFKGKNFGKQLCFRQGRPLPKLLGQQVEVGKKNIFGRLTYVYLESDEYIHRN